MDHLIYLTPKQTKRLIIRPLTWDDVEPWKAFLQDEVCTKYFSKEFVEGENASELWIESQLKRYDEARFGLTALIDKQTKKLVGQCGGLLHQWINEQDELEIGYHLFREFHGQGYATESAMFFKEMGFYFNEALSIISLIHPENKPLQAVATRNGMLPDGMATHKNQTAVIYRVIRQNQEK